MGYYINNTIDGTVLPAAGKAKVLINDGAKVVQDDEFVENMICVVNNGVFDAAAYAYNEDEFEAFKHPDGRVKIWLVHPEAKKLSGYDQNAL